MGRRQPPHFTDPKSSRVRRVGQRTTSGMRRRSPSDWLDPRIRRRSVSLARERRSPAMLWTVTVDGRDVGAVRRVDARRAGLGRAGLRRRAVARRDRLRHRSRRQGESAHRPFERAVPSRRAGTSRCRRRRPRSSIWRCSCRMRFVASRSRRHPARVGQAARAPRAVRPVRGGASSRAIEVWRGG